MDASRRGKPGKLTGSEEKLKSKTEQNERKTRVKPKLEAKP
jgi:hypothetical protein